MWIAQFCLRRRFASSPGIRRDVPEYTIMLSLVTSNPPFGYAYNDSATSWYQQKLSASTSAKHGVIAQPQSEVSVVRSRGGAPLLAGSCFQSLSGPGKLESSNLREILSRKVGRGTPSLHRDSTRGFLAATYMRGVPVVQIPTSVMAAAPVLSQASRRGQQKCVLLFLFETHSAIHPIFCHNSFYTI